MRNDEITRLSDKLPHNVCHWRGLRATWRPNPGDHPTRNPVDRGGFRLL